MQILIFIVIVFSTLLQTSCVNLKRFVKRDGPVIEKVLEDLNDDVIEPATNIHINVPTEPKPVVPPVVPPVIVPHPVAPVLPIL